MVCKKEYFSSVNALEFRHNPFSNIRINRVIIFYTGKKPHVVAVFNYGFSVTVGEQNNQRGADISFWHNPRVDNCQLIKINDSVFFNAVSI